MNSLKKCLSGCLNQRIWFGSLRSLNTEISSKTVNETTSSQEAEPPKLVYEPVLHRDLIFPNKYRKPREVWVENMDSIKEVKRGLVELHPSIFGTIPRLDIIFENVKWQTLYRKVILYSAKTRAEMDGGGRKPYPQKGLGRARQGSIRAPHFKNGGCAHGPRNPTSYFYMIPYHFRIHGLTSTLSAKLAQDDFHVVDNLNIPTEEGKYLSDLITDRHWGYSVLFVDNNDIMPRNITVAADENSHVTLMPLYGLNVYSMLKHDTLVMTLAAVNELEDKLLKLMNTANSRKLTDRFDRLSNV